MVAPGSRGCHRQASQRVVLGKAFICGTARALVILAAEGAVRVPGCTNGREAPVEGERNSAEARTRIRGGLPGGMSRLTMPMGCVCGVGGVAR